MKASIPVLMLHALMAERSPISLDPLIFASQVRWLKEHGYCSIKLADLARAIREKQVLPEKSILLTFDDGFETCYTQAAPILVEHGFTATIFLVSGYCGQKNDWPGQPAAIPRWPLMTWEQVQALDRMGFEFGAHTHHHTRLDLMKKTALESEIILSKTQIEDQLGHSVDTFCYPYGRYTSQVKEMVQANFLASCSTRLGLASLASDPYEVERIEILYLEPAFIYQGIDQPWFPGYLNFRKTLRSVAGLVQRRSWY
jgi:peptidoglycan/xylan/chitin deacetylase (PgdA/CDA1 family)